MRSLAPHLRQQLGVAGQAVRAFAASADVAVAESPFLRFGSPAPTPIDHTPLLSTIPETEVSTSVVQTPSSKCNLFIG